MHTNNELSVQVFCFSVDATKDTGRKARPINHSKKQGTLVAQLLEVDDQPCLCPMAARDIHPGEELLYDYGERSSVAIRTYPWLSK